MEPSTYNAFADMLAKFHTSPAIIQALWLVAVPATLVGMTWCLSQVLRDAIRAAGRGAALDLEALEAAAAYRTTSLSLPRSNDDEAGETLGDTVGMSEEGFGLVEHRATLDRLLQSYEGASDEKTGVSILRRSLEEPVRRIAANAGLEGSVIVEEVRKKPAGEGFDAAKGEYVNMIERGIIDPLKVTRSALENASSIATMIMTTETLITEVPEKTAPAGAPAMPEY
jgi:hypothetical protein